MIESNDITAVGAKHISKGNWIRL